MVGTGACECGPIPMLAFTYATATALVATSGTHLIIQPHTLRPTPIVMSHTSRRAVVAGAGAWALTCLEAHASFQADKEELLREEDAVKTIDALLKKARSSSFYDEIAIQKKTDSWLESLKTDDTALQAKLQAEIKALEADYAVNEKRVMDLTAKEGTEVVKEEKLRVKVKQDLAAESAAENKQLLEAEIAETKAQIEQAEPSVAQKYLAILGQ